MKFFRIKEVLEKNTLLKIAFCKKCGFNASENWYKNPDCWHSFCGWGCKNDYLKGYICKKCDITENFK